MCRVALAKNAFAMQRGGYETTQTERLGTRSALGAIGQNAFHPDRMQNIRDAAQWFTGANRALNIAIPNTAGDLDAMVKAPHATTGIPYAISGTATNVQVEVAQRLSGFQDPIKAIMGVGVHREQKIIIRRQYVAGGGAGPVPERAPARTVAIQEDTREVMLTRYGGDIEFNMNLLLRPESAKAELDMKLNAQQEQLENALVRIGYDQLLTTGTSLVNAIINSNHALHSSAAPGKHMDDIYVQTIFGALHKHPFPVHNLLAAAKRASAYDISTAKKTVMILPHGTPEMLRYSKPETMVYYVSGVGREKVDVELEGGYTLPETNCTVFTHIPPANNDHGAANPHADRSLLTRSVTIGFFTRLAAGQKMFNWDTRASHTAEGAAGVFVTFLKLRMGTGILSVPGSSVGELLLGYPSTSVSTNAATESGRMQLRCYLGAVVYRPEQVLLMEDISFEGIDDAVMFQMADAPYPVDNGAFRARGAADTAFLNGGTDLPVGPGGGVNPPALYRLANGLAPATNVAAGVDLMARFFENGVEEDLDAFRMYEGTKYDAADNVLFTNNGHLGMIDSHQHWRRATGMQVYTGEFNTAKHL